MADTSSINFSSSRELFRYYSQLLTERYPKEEAENLVLWMLEYHLGMKRKDILLDKVVDNLPQDFKEDMEKLMRNIPIQYVLGKAPFYGREFIVNPNVLIPRNETEELVHWIIKIFSNPKKSLHILDIGTGSGCIPVTLALELSGAEVVALDVSQNALDIAAENAKDLQAEIVFYQTDILKEPIPRVAWDIIVSNPPYVRESEKDEMRSNVLDHEPHLALFVPDRDPLLFYRMIAEKAMDALREEGMLFFEINEAFGEEVRELLQNLGYVEVEVRKDLLGKDRMVKAKKAV